MPRLAPAVAFALVLPALRPAHALAQPAPRAAAELSFGSGLGALWDDETMLGRGAPVRVGAGWLLGDRVLLTGDLDWLRHTRDSGYLASEGDLVGAFVRGTWLFGRANSRVRPLAGAGIGVVRSSGELRYATLVPGPRGPVPGPTAVSPWRITAAAFDLHAGARVRVTPRLAVRPEVGWRGIGQSGLTSGLETPLTHLRTMVSLDVGLP